jgi:hypothetical protein
MTAPSTISTLATAANLTALEQLAADLTDNPSPLARLARDLAAAERHRVEMARAYIDECGSYALAVSGLERAASEQAVEEQAEMDGEVAR